MAANQLRMDMNPGEYKSYIAPLKALSFKEGVFRIGTANNEARRWVESRLRSSITRLLAGILNQPVTLRFTLQQGRAGVEADFNANAEDDGTKIILDAPVLDEPVVVGNGASGGRKKKPAPGSEPVEAGSPRKIQLQKAYGTKRASVIQPERGMFLTMYFFNNWLPLLGHSAAVTVMAARSLCYWNPITGEKRDVIETDMQTIANKAAVSLRTVKDVLSNPLIKEYFLRYKVRRVMTPNGVRTAGIILQVRMDDPLTPEDQAKHDLAEDERWYNAGFEDEQED